MALPDLGEKSPTNDAPSAETKRAREDDEEESGPAKKKRKKEKKERKKAKKAEKQREEEEPVEKEERKRAKKERKKAEKKQREAEVAKAEKQREEKEAAEKEELEAAAKAAVVATAKAASVRTTMTMKVCAGCKEPKNNFTNSQLRKGDGRNCQECVDEKKKKKKNEEEERKKKSKKESLAAAAPAFGMVSAKTKGKPPSIGTVPPKGKPVVTPPKKAASGFTAADALMGGFKVISDTFLFGDEGSKWSAVPVDSLVKTEDGTIRTVTKPFFMNMQTDMIQENFPRLGMLEQAKKKSKKRKKGNA